LAALPAGLTGSDLEQRLGDLVGAGQHRIVSAGRHHAQAIPRRAIQRGDLPPGTDPAAVIDMLAGPIFLRRFIQDRPMTAAEIDELATRVVAAFTPRLPPGSTAPGQPG
jgi:hypothetical protein